MKFGILAIVSLGLGVLAGVMHARWSEPVGADLHAQVFGTDRQGESVALGGGGNPTDGKPKLVVEEGTIYDFGVMARNKNGTHAFVLRNVGTGPLTLEIQNTTCKCTVAGIDNDQLAPGESTDVLLEWEAKGYDEDFRHGATLTTNDPSQPTVSLTIVGRIMHVVRPIPADIRFDRVSTSESREHQIRIVSYKPDPLEIITTRFLKPEMQDKFEVEIEPMSDEEVRTDPAATQGYLVTVRVLPGIAVGEFSQGLAIETNFDDARLIEIPISGTSVSDVSIVGPKFSADNLTLHLGLVDKEDGVRHQLFALVRGEMRDQVSFEQSASDPEGIFRVEFGEPAPYNNGMVTRVPITVCIDPEHDPVALLGTVPEHMGRIDLRTNLPDSRDLRIHVRFAIR